MPVTGTYGFGLPTQGQVPIDYMNALLPWVQFPAQQALSMAQIQAGLQGDMAAIAAQQQGDAMRANATIQAAQIGAQGGLAQQQLATQGQINQTQAQIAAQLQQAYGDVVANAFIVKAQEANRIAAINQANRIQLAGLASSNRLADNIQARIAARGLGPVPGFGSALSGPMNDIVAADVRMPDRSLYAPPTVAGVSAPSMNFNVPAYSAGGGGGGGFSGGMGNIGGLYDQYFSQLQGLLGGFGMTFAPPSTPPGPTPPGPTPTPPPPVRPPNWIDPRTAGPDQLAAAAGMIVDGFDSNFNPIYRPRPSGTVQAMAKGGKLRSGQAALVGEEGPEALLPVKGGYQVVPLKPFAHGGFIQDPPVNPPAPAGYTGIQGNIAGFSAPPQSGGGAVYQNPYGTRPYGSGTYNRGSGYNLPRPTSGPLAIGGVGEPSPDEPAGAGGETGNNIEVKPDGTVVVNTRLQTPQGAPLDDGPLAGLLPGYSLGQGPLPNYGFGNLEFRDPVMFGDQTILNPALTAADYYRADPLTQAEYDYAIGTFMDPQFAQYLRALATPGARLNPVRAFGY